MSEEIKEVQESKKPKNVWKILTIIFALLLVVSYFKPFSGGLSEVEAKNKALTHINALLQGQAVAEIPTISEDRDLYKLEIVINGQKMESYMTKDGSLLFPSVIDTSVPPITGSTTQETPKEIPKTKTPEVKLFVMSQCPYGVLAENTIAPVLKLLGNKINFNLFFIANENNGEFQSLHGQPEVDEDIRQLCVMKYYPETYMDYVLCINKDAKNLPWESCLSENKMDAIKIKTCVSSEGKKLLSENIKEANKLNVGGSPTLVINGVETSAVYQYGNSEAYKQAVCSAFNKVYDECSEALSATTSQASGSC